MPAAFVAVRKFARAALLRGAGLFAALLFAAGFVGGVAGEGLGAGNVAHAHSDDTPNQPNNVAVAAAPGGFVITWTTPDSKPAADPINAYIIHAGPQGAIAPVLTVSGDKRAATVTGLPAVFHVVWANARNSAHDSANSGAVGVTPQAATAPSAPSASGAPTPQGVTPAKVTLSWSAPAANGSPITAYLLSYGGTVSETLPASQTATVIGVSLGVAYRFTLRAVNAIGNSPAAVVAASISPPVTAPSAVQNLSVFRGDRQFIVTWDPPSDWGNSQLSAYIVTMARSNIPNVYTVTNAAITLTSHSSHSDGVLNPADNYKIQVVPYSQAGLAGPRVEQVPYANASPDAPNVTTSAPASGTQLSVSWSAANNNSWNTAATAYAVRLGAVNATLGSGTTATIIGNLQGNTAYTLSVWGISPIGAGAARVITATTAISPAPGEPRNFTLVSRDARTGLVLAWDEPSSWAGSSLSVYRLQFRLESGSWDTHETTDTRHTITTYSGSSLGSWVGAASQVEFRILARSHAGLNSQLVNLDVPQEVVSSPNAPIVTATALAGGTQISVGWSPANNSGHNTGATAYALRLGAVSVEIASATTATIIGGLQGNTAYTLSVWGISPIGAGAARVLTVTTATPPAAAPGRPTGVAASSAPGGLNVSWQAPSDTGGSAITEYIIVAYTSGDFSAVKTVTVSGDARSAIVTGLTPGVGHAVDVKAKNSSGTSSASQLALAMPGAVTAPSVSFATVTALASGTEISVSLSVNNGGSALTGLTLLYGGTAALTLSPTTRAAVIASLSANTAYTLSIVAVNAVGAATAVATATTPGAAPDAPTLNAAATPTGETPAQITLGWSAPNNGGSAITAYFLSYGTVSANLPASATASVVSVSFDVAYSFTLRAVNAVGASPAAVVSARVFSAIGNPGPARNLRITRIYADGLGFDFAWDPPEHWGGGGVGTYNLRYKPPGQGGNGNLVATDEEETTTRTASFPDVPFTYGQTLLFYIWTRNVQNYWTAPSHTLTVVPSAPPAATAPSVSFATVTALASGTEISVSLSVDDGGSSLTGLTLLYGGTAALSLSPTTRAAVIASLSANTAYTLSIVAVNSAGAATAVATATTPAAAPPPVTNPDKPRNVRAVEVGDGFVVIAWDEPASWGGSTMSVYRPYYREAGDSWSRIGGADVTVYATSYTLTQSGLNNGNAYHFHVLAQSRANLWSQNFVTELLSPSFVATVTATPQAAAAAPSVSFATVTALASGTEISVSLSVADGGSSLTGLTLLYGGTAALSLSPTTRAAVIASLSANTAYTLSLVAVNAAGAATAVATATTPAQPITDPGPPRNVSVVEMGADYVVFAWDEPASWGGSSLSIYIFWYQRGSDSWSGGLSTSDNRLTMNTDLGAGESYKAHVFARSAANRNSGFLGQLIGNSITPQLSFVFTPPPVTAPDAPTVNVVTTPVGEAAATVALSWSAPANGGSAITGYILGYGTVSANLPASQTATAIGVSLGVAYSFTLQAANSVGASPAAVVSASIAASFTNPSDVRNIVAVTGSLSFVLSWDEPADWGGSTLSIYRIGWRDGNDNTHIVETADNKVTLSTHHHGAPSHSPLVAGNNYYMLIGARSQANLDSSYIRFPASGFLVATAIAAPSVSFATVTALTSGTEISISLLVDDGGGLSGLTLLYGGTEELSLPPATRATVITGLSVNTAYTLSIVAVNAVGAATAVATATTPSAPPSAVQNLSLVSSDARVGFVFSWDAPASWGGSSLSVYRLSLNIASNDWQAYETTDTRITITRYSGSALHLWEPSPFFWARVIARSQAGLDSSYVQINGSNVAASPHAPIVAATALAGGTEISVSWRKASNTPGNNNATAYAVHLGTVAATLGSAITATVVGNLQGNTGYTLSVWAINAVGMGGVRVLTLTTAPTAPSAPVLAAAATPAGATPSQVTLSWSVADNGGAAVTAYILSYGNVSATLPGNANMTVIGGITAGVEYRFTLQAQNSVGASPPATVAAIIASVPARPVFMATLSNNGAGTLAILSWTVPDNGADAPTGFTLSYDGTPIPLPPAASGYTITLERGRQYNFTLVAANANGASDPAVASLVAPAMPNAPRLSLAVLGNGFGVSVSLSWSVAMSVGNAVESFVLSYNGGSHTLAASVTSTVVAGLTRGQSYAFALHAVNAAGNSQTARAAAAIRLLAPGAPANLSHTAGDKTLTFEWSAPASWGGSEETGESTLGHYYVVHFYDSAASVLHTAAITATQITISQSEGLSVSLANGQQYGFSVAAVNQASVTSEFSALSNVRPRGVGQDAAPDAVVLQAAAGAFSRAFSTPINDRLLAIDGGGNAASAGFMGANFAGAGGVERGIAQLLKRHGNAIANGGNFDSAALRNGSFVMPLGNGGGNAGAGAMGLAKSDILSDLAGIVDRLTDWLGKAGGGAGNMLDNAAVWGGASYRGVENNKNADKWEGNSASYYLGIDSAVGEANENGGVLAGVVFAHNRFNSDYKLANNGGEGEYNVAANSAHPYLLWRSANGKNRAWGSFGFGVGNVERKGAAGDASDRSAKVGGGSAGFRGAVWQRKGVAIDAQADWSFANINIDGGAAARANNLRALLEARGSVAMAGGGFGSPFAQLGYVRQADDANNGAGWEAAAGWRWRGAGGWSGELRGGAADISNGNKEWSAAGVLRKAAANSKGFSMSLRPQYGDAGGSNIAGGGDFWSMPVAKESANPRLGINAKLGYGFTAANALWKPYLSANTAAGASAAYGAGAAWQNLLQSNLALRAAVQAQRQEQATALQLRFTATY